MSKLTVSSSIFRATLEQAQFVAECANLRNIRTPQGKWDDQWWGWEDAATGGGGCRITWADGVAWVSRHSGYAYADITEDVCEIFAHMGCKPTTGRNPRIYGYQGK